MKVEAQLASARPYQAPFAATDPSAIARDPFLSPAEKLKRLRNLVEAAKQRDYASTSESVAIHRAIFELYDRHPRDLKPFIYE